MTESDAFPELPGQGETEPLGEPPVKQPAKPSLAADVALPPVRAPKSTFILQLFLIPLLIVSIIVLVLMMFRGLAHLGEDPRRLVQDLRKLNDGSWNKAVTLSTVLRDPRRADIKLDHELAGDLADVLKTELDSGPSPSDNRRQLRVYVCKALGEFQVTDGLDQLVRAVEQTADSELFVRLAAVEAIAVLADNVGPETVREHAGVERALLAAADVEQPHRELQSTAAFALGVLGGEAALEQLRILVDRRGSGSYPNTRYNATTGLARNGDLAAIRGLEEMLDPQAASVVQDEVSDSARLRKRSFVMMNGIRAVELLVERGGPDLPLQPLEQQLQTLVDQKQLPADLHVAAQRALISLRQRREPQGP